VFSFKLEDISGENIQEFMEALNGFEVDVEDKIMRKCKKLLRRCVVVVSKLHYIKY